MIKKFAELMTLARSRERKKLAVAAAGEREVLKAVKLAVEEELVTPLLVGDREEILALADRVGLKKDKFHIMAVRKKEQICKKAVRLTASGEADILMKGLVDTSLLMKTVLNKEYGLRTGKVISHIAIVEAKNIGRLIFVTDGGMNIKPDLDQRKEIIQNTIDFTKKLGYDKPRVAVLAAVEKINPQMKETVEAAALSKMGDRGQIKGGIIDGPLAIDNALSAEAARIKGIDSPVAGRADILNVPEIVSGNILGKGPIYFAGDRIAAIIGGTSHPVIVTSRANSADIKLISIAAAVLAAD